MDRQTFRDAIALRLGRDLPDPLPTCCPSCGEAGFDVSHALKCKAGDWVRRRHDEVAKAWMRLFKRVSPTVQHEPFLAAPVNLQRNTTSDKAGAKADIMATGTERLGQNTFYDVAVLDTGAVSYRGLKAMTVLRNKEKRKIDKYEERAQMLGGTFVPLVCSIYGTLAPECVKALNKVVADLNGDKPEKRSTASYHRVGLQVAILKATSLCLRARSVTRVAMADARPVLDEGPLPPQPLSTPARAA
jgi:hypothetical protein